MWMTLSRPFRFSAVLLLLLILLSCGETYRPVATPLIPTPSNPAADHAILMLSRNGSDNPGASSHIDVSGDTNIGVAPMGLGPVHATLVPNASRMYVANSLEGTVTSLGPQTIGPVATTSLGSSVSITDALRSGSNTTYGFALNSGSPLVAGMPVEITGMVDGGNNGSFTISAVTTNTVTPLTGTFTVQNSLGVTAQNQSGTGTASSVPVFVTTTENTTVYVANFRSNTVSAISTSTNIVLDPPIKVGANPVALAETPDAARLYSANSGDGTVTSIDTVARTPIVNIPTGNSPVWIVARPDSVLTPPVGFRIYVLNSGSGTVSDIDSVTDKVLGNVTVGAGANFMAYNKANTRLYVVNPNATSITVLDASTDPPTAASPIDLTQAPTGTPLCATGCHPVSIAILPDGTRAYVASYAIVSDSGWTPAVPAIEWQVSVVNLLNNTIRTVAPLDPSQTLVDVDNVNPTGCGTSPFGASPLPFRLSITASGDSSQVYVAGCDSGTMAVLRTSDDTFLIDTTSQGIFLLAAPPGVFKSPALSITGAAQIGSTLTYTYAPTPGPVLRVGQAIAVTGLANCPAGSDNGTFTIVALGAGTITVGDSSGCTLSAQSGTGVPTLPQNPGFTLAGP